MGGAYHIPGLSGRHDTGLNHEPKPASLSQNSIRRERLGKRLCEGEDNIHVMYIMYMSNFSRLGIQCPTLIYVMFVRSGLMRWVSFYSF